jgi:hypothetical protein
MILLGGYLPLAAACLALAVVMILFMRLCLEDDHSTAFERVDRILFAMIPFAVAAVLLSPYLFSVYIFLRQSPIASRAELFYSAHQMSELPPEGTLASIPSPRTLL